MVRQNKWRLGGSRRLAITSTIAFGAVLLVASMALSVAGDVGRTGPTGARAVAATGSAITLEADSTPCTIDELGSRAERPDTLVIGRDAAHRVCANVEAHWSAVYLQGGLTYTIETRRLGSTADTQLAIYDPNGTSVLATDDDGGTMVGASRIVVTATTSATYLVRVSRAKASSSDHELLFDLRAT